MTFGNTILSGETLAREAIQSEGFETGVQGWRIERDGDAELNDVTIRGDLESDNYVPGVSGYRIDSDTGTVEANDFSGRGSMRVQPGTTYAEMAVHEGNATIEFGDTALNEFFYIYVSGSGVTLERWDSDTASSIQTDLLAFGDSGIGQIVFPNDSFSQAGYIIDKAREGFIYRVRGSEGFAAEDWVFPGKATDWSDLANHGALGYRLLPTGLVALTGNAVAGAGAGNTIFTVPFRYRPATDVRIPAFNPTNNNCRVVVRGNTTSGTPGDVQVFGWAVGDNISIEGATYPVAITVTP